MKSACSFYVLYYSFLEEVGRKLRKEYYNKIKQNNKMLVKCEIKVSRKSKFKLLQINISS